MSCTHDSDYINGWDGYFSNYQSNYFMNGVYYSYHNDHHEDRRWKYNYCKPPDKAYVGNRQQPKTGYDSTFTIDCGANGALIGGTSSHNDHHEDREWIWYCGDLDTSKYYLSDCNGWTGWINGWDASFSFYCPNNGVMRAIDSYHDNHHEDRRW